MIVGVISKFFKKPGHPTHFSRHHHMIKLIKITIKYIKGAYTTDKHNLIIGIPFSQVG